MAVQTDVRSYRILERLGQGAFGAVYLAETVGGGLSRRVAIKVPHPDRASMPGLVGRLRDEARMLALIRHRAIVRVDDLVELDGAWSMIMEYVEGLDVGELLDDGPFPVRAALAIAEEVANALHAAWNQPGPEGTALRLLHRDLKPSNLRITPAGEVKVLDFGVARAEFAAREAEDSGAVFGTTTYLAPERYRGEDAQAGDVYALGVTLFEMLTGVLPGRSAMDADRQPPGRSCTAQWAWLANVHPDLCALVAAMLAPDPAGRPAPRDCARRLHELRAVVGGETLEDWAERVVRPRLEERRARPASDTRTGTLLIERSTTSAAPRRSRGAPRLLLGGLGVLALASVATAVWVTVGAVSGSEGAVAELSALSADDAVLGSLAAEAPVPPVPMPSAPEPAAEAAAPSAAPAVPVAARSTPPSTAVLTPSPVAAPTTLAVASPPAAEPTTTAVPTASGDPVVAEPPAAAAEPSPVAAVEAPPAPPPAGDTLPPGHGRVRADGDAVSMSLVGPGGRTGPGVVPAGTWRVEATLPDGTAVALDEVSVPDGGTVVVRCSQRFRGCRAASGQ